MKKPFFEYPSYQYEVSDWEFKKKGLLKRINDKNFVRDFHSSFEGDRSTNEKTYVRYLSELLNPELSEFCTEAKVSCTMTDAWTVRYQKGDYQSVHNHRGWGFSGILYVEYDPKVHTPTCFVAPWQEPRTDKTLLRHPPGVKEGTLLIFPSFCFHYVDANQTRKQRTAVSFDLLPDLPEHQSINNIA